MANHVVFRLSDVVHVELVEDVLAPQEHAPVVTSGCNTHRSGHCGRRMANPLTTGRLHAIFDKLA